MHTTISPAASCACTAIRLTEVKFSAENRHPRRASSTDREPATDREPSSRRRPGSMDEDPGRQPKFAGVNDARVAPCQVRLAWHCERGVTDAPIPSRSVIRRRQVNRHPAEGRDPWTTHYHRAYGRRRKRTTRCCVPTAVNLARETTLTGACPSTVTGVVATAIGLVAPLVRELLRTRCAVSDPRPWIPAFGGMTVTPRDDGYSAG